MEKISFEDYQLEDTIGVGTVGTIFRARKTDTNEVFALKLLSPGVSRDKIVVARFEREVLILSKLNHPNIVTCYGSGRHNGQLFYTMDLVTGGTLKEVLSAHGSVTWQEAAECGRQIAAALQHAHNHGIVHRDLKPGNVFLMPNGQVKLGDFGIARDLMATDITDAGLTVGTYAYMAPEIVKGEREITGNVDLYALGCLLYEMIAGQTPFVGDNFAQIFEQHLKSEPTSLQELNVGCPKPLDDLIMQLLAKNPEERPFNARTVQGILGELTDHVGSAQTGADRAASAVRPGQISLSQRLTRMSARYDVSWGVVAMTFAAIVVAVATYAIITN